MIVFIVLVIGTAGSGKSSLSASFTNWLKMEGQDAITVNLDPGVITLPYVPNIDIRDQIKVEDIMEQHELGPNGALVLAADLIADESQRLGEEIELLDPDVVVVDTPGQMELFAFRASGPYIVKELTNEPKAIVYLFDSVFSSNPLNYVSNLFLSAAVYNRFLIPQLHVLSKRDLLPSQEVERITDWATNIESLELAMEEKGSMSLLSRDVMKAIYQLGLFFDLIPVSAKTNEGLINFNASLLRIYGEDDWNVPHQ